VLICDIPYRKSRKHFFVSQKRRVDPVMAAYTLSWNLEICLMRGKLSLGSIVDVDQVLNLVMMI
jgi:hypothetical protein